MQDEGKGGVLEYRVEIPRGIWDWGPQASKTGIQVFRIGRLAGRKRGNKETKNLEQTVDYKLPGSVVNDQNLMLAKQVAPV